MTPTDMFLALVMVYSNTGVPSGSLPKSRFSMLPATAVVVAMKATTPAMAPICAAGRKRTCHEVRSLTTDSTLYFRMANPPGSERSLTHDMHGTCSVYARFGAGARVDAAGAWESRRRS